MKKALGAILIGSGLFSLIIASLSARNAPNVSYLIGTFLPGLLLLILGLMLGGAKALPFVERFAGDAQSY
jgi:hypothetical protein